jgi:hypothetical protein
MRVLLRAIAFVLLLGVSGAYAQGYNNGGYGGGGGGGGGGNLAAPGPIGGTTPSTGQFTNLGINTTPGTGDSITWPTTGGAQPSGTAIANNGNDLWLSGSNNTNIMAGGGTIAQFNGGGSTTVFYPLNVGVPTLRSGTVTLAAPWLWYVCPSNSRQHYDLYVDHADNGSDDFGASSFCDYCRCRFMGI